MPRTSFEREVRFGTTCVELPGGAREGGNLMKRDRRSENVYLPDSHDIQQACEEIQEGWSDRERLKRSGRMEGQHWLPPLIESETLFPDGLSGMVDVPVG